MKRWRLWGCFKRSFLFPTKLFFLKLNSHLLRKPKVEKERNFLSLLGLFYPFALMKACLMAGNGNGLLSLYKDIESCGEYRDIQNNPADVVHNLQENFDTTLDKNVKPKAYLGGNY
uniref:Uncharacterized protein n=1 Tax=Cucumis melo TaxID=3656 RepID=A0A9I9EGL3_CUCME